MRTLVRKKKDGRPHYQRFVVRTLVRKKKDGRPHYERIREK